MSARRVIETLEVVALERSYPARNRVDYGPEFCGAALDARAHERRVSLVDPTFTNQLHYSYRSACVGAIRDALRAGT